MLTVVDGLWQTSRTHSMDRSNGVTSQMPEAQTTTTEAQQQSAAALPEGAGRHRGRRALTEDAQAPGHGKHRRPAPPRAA
ncbi:hypothetical protein ACZ90_69985 [Streptomyces albus subsp. albus]|nr:hypothetical protein ACZ90_69985 [Streptomyces albus subsp. albus]